VIASGSVRTSAPLSALVAILCAFCACDVKSAADVGSSAQDFTARDVDGNNFRLSDHIGKEVILIDFWATWCTPCLAEMPHLERMWEQNKSRGFLVVAVSMDGPESIADVPAFAKRNQMNFTVLLDEDSSIAGIYNPRKSAPLGVIIDKGGHISAVREGYNAGDEAFVEKDVLKALGTAAQAAPTATATATATATVPPAPTVTTQAAPTSKTP
jgi:peroxiredoxin